MNVVVIIGLGQLGRVFAGGLLRVGCSVVPVNRGDDMAALAQRHPAPELVLVAVGRKRFACRAGCTARCLEIARLR